MTLTSMIISVINNKIKNIRNIVDNIALQILAPRPPIPRSSIKRLFLRALRNGSWHRLDSSARALIYAAIHASVRVYRGKKIVSVLQHIWLEIEKYTVRGQAILVALSYLLIKGVTLTHVLKISTEKLMVMGLQLINDRIYGLGAIAK